jgi:hypothetical protein
MKHVVAAFWCVIVVSPCALFAQPKPPKDPEVEKQKEEDERVERTAERANSPGASEREVVFKMVSKLAPADPNAEAGLGEVDVIFNRLTGGQSEWSYEIARNTNGGGRDLFERVAGRVGVPESGRITRQQFRDYAASFLRDGNSPPWRSPTHDEDTAFRALDRNKDGAIDAAESSAMLRASMARIDRNRDGFVDRNEFATYFGMRVETEIQKRDAAQFAKEAKQAEAALKAAQSPKAVVATPKIGKAAEKPEAVRFGHLPKGLPDWFATLDEDHDGQVGLYEWRHSGWPTSAFEPIDSNDDGLLTCDEWLHFAKDFPEEASLFQLVVSAKDSPARGLKPTKVKAR